MCGAVCPSVVCTAGFFVSGTLAYPETNRTAESKPVAMSPTEISDSRRRVVIERVRPSLDCGRFPIKRTVGQKILVSADIFADGHDVVTCVLQYRHEREPAWREILLESPGNDLWQ